MEDAIKYHRKSISAERDSASCHFVEDRAKGEKISACVKFLPQRLLGRHICHRPKSCSRTSEKIYIISQSHLSGNIRRSHLRFSWCHFRETKIQDLRLTPRR